LKRTKFRQVLECGDGACAVTAFACAGLTLPKLAADSATLSQSGDFADFVAAVQDAVAPKPVSSKLSVNHCPERGCVVLDQPQHAVKFWCSGFFHALRLVFDTSALLLIAALTTVSFLLLCPASAHAQGGVPLWTNVFQGERGFSVASQALAVDSSGSVLVCGPVGILKYSNDGVPLWTNYFPRPLFTRLALAVDNSGNVFFLGINVIAYSSAGVPLWTNQRVNAITLDNDGNVFVAGFSAPPGNTNYATIKYSNAGVPLWTNRYNGPGNGDDRAWAIAVDRSGNVFVTGESQRIFGESQSVDYATIKYSNEGVGLWTNRYDGGFYDSANAIAVDSSGNVFVTGESSVNRDAAISFADYATVAYSNSGVPLWTNRYDGPANEGDIASAIAVDSSGNVFVTGESVTVRDFISDPPDYATINYSNAGVPLWTNYYNGPANMSDQPSAIAVDSTGNVFVTGLSFDAPCCPVSTAYATIAYSKTGELLWENRCNGPDNVYSSPHSIAVDRAGNVFVTGYSWGSDDYAYYTTIKYSSSLPAPVQLDFQKLNNELVLSWTNAGFHLQSAPAVTGQFADILGATSPYTNITTGAQQFFRLKSD
jgi:hypothetical protein